MASSSSAGRRTTAVLLGLVLALAAAVGVLLSQRGLDDPRDLVELAVESDEVRQAAIERLVEGGGGVWDSFPDPDVARVMQPGVAGREFRGVEVSSNEYGMRERSYALPKPAGVTRICLLGDSFVYGYKVEADERLGVFLERFLRERTGAAPDSLEVLHLAVSSWNVTAECAYLRRQLAQLRPDLVVHVTVVNDLEDTKGARGFGAMGFYTPQFPYRINGMVSDLSYGPLWPRRVPTYLLYGIDHESRSRYEKAGREIARLADAIEAAGGRYLHLAAWQSYNPMAGKYLATGLADEEAAYVSATFTEDLRFRIGPSDRHWNPAGHERMAKLLYGLIVRRELLPGLAPPSWDEADAEVERIHARGRLESLAIAAYEAALLERATERIGTRIDLGDLSADMVKQVHGGIDAEGRVAPYASVIFATKGGTRLTVSGARLPGPGLEGATAEVWIEEFDVGRIELDGTGPIALDLPLPEETLDRPFVNVRFVATDYLYTDLEKRHAGAFVLDVAAIE